MQCEYPGRARSRDKLLLLGSIAGIGLGALFVSGVLAFRADNGLTF